MPRQKWNTAVKANCFVLNVLLSNILDFSPLFCSCLLCSRDNQLQMKSCTYQIFLPTLHSRSPHQYLGNTAMQRSKWEQWPQQMSSLPMPRRAGCMWCRFSSCSRCWRLLCNVGICSWCKTILLLQCKFSAIRDTSFSTSSLGQDIIIKQHHKITKSKTTTLVCNIWVVASPSHSISDSGKASWHLW